MLIFYKMKIVSNSFSYFANPKIQSEPTMIKKLLIFAAFSLFLSHTSSAQLFGKKRTKPRMKLPKEHQTKTKATLKSIVR